MDSDDEYFYQEFVEEEEDENSDDEDYRVVATLAEEEEEENAPQRFRGSTHGHLVVHREREERHVRLYRDYFAANPVFKAPTFRRRFRMSRDVFMRLVDVKRHDSYFKLKRDCTGKLGLSPIQKCTAAIRMLAYGAPADAIDEYLRLAESTALEAMVKFCTAVVHVFGEEYLRAPNAEDTARLMAIGNARGFPGMLGCIDCMH